ncbi:MAG TPA: hypothetical protein VMV47_04635 [Bacteroidales bacterium]|nr:hypothetical protein [Bacteroidales bacterium]
MKYFLFILALISLLVAPSCKQGPKEKESFEPSFSTYKENEDSGAPVEKNEIFYGILNPVEISSIFNRLGVPYNNAILNPVSNKDNYQSNAKASINTGIYGVDLGYIKIFGIGQGMIDYLVTIGGLCNKLGIPDHFVMEPIRIMQSDIADPDTIMQLMNNAFEEMENHLRAGGRESTAGLMVLGGWVESLYISTQSLDDTANPDPELVQKIAEQKYTLTTLLSFLKNYYDDPVVVYYTKKLKYLKHYFDSFDIYFRKGDLEIDRTRQVFRASGSEMTITVENLNNIRDYVIKLRTEMVTP